MSSRARRREARSAGTPEPAPHGATLRDLRLQDVHEIRLLLRGDSIVDWHRLGLTSLEDVRRLLAVNGIDPESPHDQARLEDLRAEAAHYIKETLGLRLDDHVASQVSPQDLPLLASSRGRWQRQACTLLKVMNIIYHLDARELRMALPIPDSELFSLVEESVASLFDELRAAGVPVVEFAWSRKAKDSLITKMLVKRETSAARVFDRLRFRLVVERPRDLVPTLHVMLRRFIPFNYVVPDQSLNTLIDTRTMDRRLSRTRDFSVVPPKGAPANEFSGRGYRILNFVADLPVRVDELLADIELSPADARRGRTVFVLAEFQIVDQAHAAENEEGESSHAQYKHRQHQRVRERLLREPKRSPREPK